MKSISGLFLVISLFGCSRKLSTKVSSLSSGDSASMVVSSGPAEKTPICIAQKIESIKKERIWNPPAEIHEYEYEGKKVYAISANCCDFFTTVVDANCKEICAPSGGFTGKGDGKCPDFFNQAKHLRLVWKDERTRK